jgi:hypothetical protein
VTGPFEHSDTVSTHRRTRRLSPATPAPTTITSRGSIVGAYQSGSCVSSGGRLADAADDRIASVTHLARLVATDAWTDGLGPIGGELADHVRVGDLGTGHLDAVADIVADRPFGLTPIDDRALEEHGRG